MITRCRGGGAGRRVVRWHGVARLCSGMSGEGLFFICPEAGGTMGSTELQASRKMVKPASVPAQTGRCGMHSRSFLHKGSGVR